MAIYSTSDDVFQYFFCHYSSYNGSPWGPSASSYQKDMVLPPLLMPLDTSGVIGIPTVSQQLPQSQVIFQAYADYTIGPLYVSFSFRVEPPTHLYIYVGICSGVCFLLSGSMWMLFPPMGLNCWGLPHCSPLEHACGRHICILVMVQDPYHPLGGCFLYCFE